MNRIARRLRRKERLKLIVLVGITGCTEVCLVFSGSHPAIAATLISTSFCLSLLLLTSYLKMNYCVIHPYFSKKLSTDLPHTAFNGKEIAAHLDELDAFLHKNGFQSISDFGYQQTNVKKMYRPDDLLTPLNFLIHDDSFVESNLRSELTQWIKKINIARDEGALVAVHMRITDGVSGFEIDRLPGTY